MRRKRRPRPHRRARRSRRRRAEAARPAAPAARRWRPTRTGAWIAAPPRRGRLGERPGLARRLDGRSRSRCCWSLGAVAAGYAALNGDAQKQAPPVAAAPQTQAQVTPPTAPRRRPPPATDPARGDHGADHHAEAAAEGQDAHAGRRAGSPVTPTPAPTPTPTTARRPEHPSATGPARRRRPRPHAPTPATPPARSRIELGGDAATSTTPTGARPARRRSAARARRRHDDLVVRRPRDPRQIGVGLAVDLRQAAAGSARSSFSTTTPGFRVEVYATDEAARRPTSSTRAGATSTALGRRHQDDGTQTIVLGAGTTKYRHVLLWFTQPPRRPEPRITELKLLG